MSRFVPIQHRGTPSIGPPDTTLRIVRLGFCGQISQVVTMRFEATTIIAAPPALAFEFLADFTRDSEWKSDCVSCELVDGDGSAGSKLHYVSKILGKTSVSDSEIDSYEADRSISFKLLEGRPASGWRTFEPVDGGTRVTVGYELDLSVMFGPLGAMVAAIGKRQVTHDLETAKVILEHAVAAA